MLMISRKSKISNVVKNDGFVNLAIEALQSVWKMCATTDVHLQCWSDKNSQKAENAKQARAVWN